MPRASWKGFLRLSLVSCPVTLSPATTRAKTVRLHQVWQPRGDPRRSSYIDDEDLEELPQPAPSGGRQSRHSAPDDDTGSPQRAEEEAWSEPVLPAARIALRPHDPESGAEIERDELLKGYEYQRGQFVTFTAKDLKALDVESSKTIDLATFVPRGEVDPIYFSTPYYLYPDGPIAAEALQVIGAAMADAGMAGLGRLTLSRRERMVLVEPARGGGAGAIGERRAGMVLITLRAAEEVRAADFPIAESELDADMVAIAAAIIDRRRGKFDPTTFRDRYQEALRELVDAKLRGLAPAAAEPAAPPAPVVDLMAALKRSLAREGKPASSATAKRRASAAAADRRQRNLLLPVSGKGQTGTPAADTGAATAPKQRRKRA